MGVQGAEPQKRNRLKGNTSQVTRDNISKLSAQYLRRRNHAIDLKSKAAELDLALKRGTPVEKRLVEQQATWILLAMRRKLMNLESHAHKFLNLTDPNQARQILRAIGLNVLQEVKDLPKTVNNPNWLKKLRLTMASKGGSESLLLFHFSAQDVRALNVSEPVKLVYGCDVILDCLDVRELPDSSKRPLIRGPT